MAAEPASTLTGTTPKRMNSKDLINFLIEEANHCVINDKRSKNSDHVLVVSAKKGGKGKSKACKAYDKATKSGDDETCTNCKREGHKSENCYGKGGRKEGQAPWQ